MTEGNTSTEIKAADAGQVLKKQFFRNSPSYNFANHGFFLSLRGFET
jgi:hypothetical protein